MLLTTNFAHDKQVCDYIVVNIKHMFILLCDVSKFQDCFQFSVNALNEQQDESKIYLKKSF